LRKAPAATGRKIAHAQQAGVMMAVAFLGGTISPSAGAPAADASVSDPAPDHGNLPRFEISISYTANLIHWIDNLAGSSRGKTIRSYRRYWQARFATPTTEETELLRSWSLIRFKTVARPAPAILNRGGCLPQEEEVPDWRRTFRVRSYEAASVEDFIDSLAGDLTPEESGEVRRVIEAFRPRFDEVWKEMTYLPRFEERFRAFLDEGGVRAYLGEVAAFFGVDPSASPPGRIHLMALPEDGPTHAQADGRDLLMEIRPGDSPADQIQVIAHESSHYFWSLMSPERHDALARQVHAAGKAGPVVWLLLREALPTALGQGLAEARLQPSMFSLADRWYHVESVDAFAKEIYPLVAASVGRRRRIDRGVFKKVARRAESLSVVLDSPPADYLAWAVFAVGEGLDGASAEIRRGTGLRERWIYRPSDPNAQALLENYECLSGVVFLGPEDVREPERLPAVFTPPGPASAGGTPRSAIRAVRRPGGGTLFYLIAARSEDAGRLGDAFLRLPRRPDAPIFLDPPAGAGAGSTP